MKRSLAGFVVLVALLGGLGARADEACSPPRCLDVAVPVPAGLIVPESTVRVVLPEGYDPGGTTRYPVVYLLHGVGDTYAKWVENTDLVPFSADYDVIIVMPDGGRTPDSGWYSDWVDESRDWESFHVGVVIDYIDRHFTTLGDGHRAVAGFSMGGFGAMSYAARHPDLFEAAASFSGVVDTRYLAPVSGVGFELANDRFGTPDDRVWGDQLADAETWKEHNPTDRAADLAGTELFIATGTGTPGGPAGDDPGNPGAYGVEAFVLQLNVSFLRALRLAGVPYHVDVYPGYHDWPYWERALHWALPQLVDAID